MSPRRRHHHHMGDGVSVKKMPMCPECKVPSFTCKHYKPKGKKHTRKLEPGPHMSPEFKERVDAGTLSFEEDYYEDEEEELDAINRLERELLGEEDTGHEFTDGFPPEGESAPRRASPKKKAQPPAIVSPSGIPIPDHTGASSAFLLALALAHQKHEGFYPGSLAYRNNNPGNLRFIGQAGAFQGQGGFAGFNTYNEGLNALMNDLRAKLTGHSAHVNPNGTFQDYVNVYAPGDDGNDPHGYAAALIADLNAHGYPITMNMPLSQVAQYI